MRRVLPVLTALAVAAVLPVVASPTQATPAGVSPGSVETTSVGTDADPAPVPLSPPSIAGTAQVGQTLTAVGATWPVDGTSKFVWSVDQRRANSATLVLYGTDVDSVITLTETFSSPGFETATATATTATIITGPSQPALLATTIAGLVRVGQKLTATTATWPHPGSSDVVWTVSDTVVGTGLEYVVAVADLGKPLTVTESRTSPGFYDVATSVARGGVVAPGAAPEPTVRPQITGTVRAYSTLTATPATWPLTGTSTFVWSANGEPVGTGRTFEVVPAVAGKTLTFTESFTSPGYDTSTATNRLGLVGKAPVTLTAAVRKAKRGKKVRLNVTVVAESPGLTLPSKVRVTYAGKKVPMPTLENGKLTAKLPKKPKGTYWLTVSYAGTAGIGKDSTTVAVSVR